MRRGQIYRMGEQDLRAARAVLATNLRRLRSAQGLSQEQLAERAGIHRNYLGGIERRERNVGLDNIERIARALSVTISDLLSVGPN